MHGRLKVRSTEEQQERKRLEREKKLQLYKDVMSLCLKKIANKEYDQVGLNISGEILSSNCNVQTLWNLRKSIIEAFQVASLVEQAEASYSESQMIQFYLQEMSLTESCLKKDPKSYGAWYHRKWCLQKANQHGYGEKAAGLNWKNELKLCDLFLKSDERNFHCWTHRLAVVKCGNLSKLDELEFTMSKISSNFSNYSAWHYRSKLIEELYSADQIDSDIFKRELTLIQNALYTDPNDQSAWIYGKWLLLDEFKAKFRSKDAKLDSELMENHLKAILDLLQFEPENKWCLIRLVELMSMVDYNKYKDTILTYLDKLATEIDLYRKDYYLDMKNKIIKTNSLV
jgi:geranylgeranyl transferase type-2 subunit alpha